MRAAGRHTRVASLSNRVTLISSETRRVRWSEAELDRLQEQFGQLVRERFRGAPIERVAVLGYGDDPEIEPGQLLARVYLQAGAGQADREQAVKEFHQAHGEAVHELRRDLDRLPGVGLLEVVAAGEEEADCRGPRLRLMTKPGPAPGGEGQLVPVMARLAPGRPGDRGRADHGGDSGQPRGGRALGIGPNPGAPGVRAAPAAGAGDRGAQDPVLSSGARPAGPAPSGQPRAWRQLKIDEAGTTTLSCRHGGREPARPGAGGEAAGR